MVNTRKNLSAYTGTPPSDDQADRSIVGGPLYAKADVLAVLTQGESSVVPWTCKCKDDVLRLALDADDLRALVKEAVQGGRYVQSEWCVQQPNGPWAACDAYQLFRSEWVQAAHKNMRFEYYVKFAMGRTGKLLLLVSCHLSQDRG
ncbi:MAG: hypothetical protein PHE55_12670 [Methylococcaceae bacterium]|nr:hypothetical protein [Methylococcaceae bacterium]